ncbi:MAG TPA: hypothetical protein VGN17_04110 [Bryobacteraceae bacterium]
MTGRLQIGLVLTVLAAGLCRGQNDPQDNQAASGDKEDKRILWVIPNYRTSPSLNPYVPLTARQKFKLGSQAARIPSTAVRSRWRRCSRAKRC